MTGEHSWEGRLGCAHAAFGTHPGHALPGDGPRWPRDRAVAVEHLRLEVTLDVPAKSVRGTATHRVRAFNDGLDHVAFDAIELRIREVAVDGHPVRFSHDGVKLEVMFSRPLARDARAEIAITYEATPRLGLYFIAPDEGYPDKPYQVWSQNQDEDGRYWFPCIDDVGQKYSFELIATVPEAWRVLSNGVLLSEGKPRDGRRTFHWRQEKPLATYLMSLVAGEFERIDASRPGLTIDYLVEANAVEDARRTFASTPAMIALFEEKTGVDFPWDKYSQVVVRDFIFGGMENTSATTLTDLILFDRKASVDFDGDYLVSHELAHMWWGDLLTCRDWSHGWLNEGFATFFEMLWDEARRGPDEYAQGVLENTELYLGERYRRPVVSPIFNEPIDIFDRHLYEKGSLVLHMLRQVLGDDAFFRSVRRYCRTNQYQSVITQNLIDAIAEETGRRLEWFFDQWVFRPGHPCFKVSWSWDERTKAATVSVKQTQDTKDGTAIFRMPLTIDFVVGRARPRAFTVEVTGAEHTFVFPLSGKPDLCRFDPTNAVLKEIDFEKSLNELRLQLRDDDHISGRVYAAGALGRKGGGDAVAALADAVMRDRYWSVQAAAAKALGVIRSEAARDALIACLAVRNPRARLAVVAALGEFRGDEKASTALLPLARRDRSWFVEAEAHRSIGKVGVAGAFEVLVAGMERPSFRQVIRQSCIDGFVELRDERGFEPLLAAMRYGAPAHSRQFAAAAVGRLGAIFPARAKELAREILPYLDDRDFRVRIATARALQALRDPSHAPALDRMAKRELDGRGVRAAREAAIELRKGATPPEDLRNLRDDLEKLRAENARLQDRVERIETREAPTKPARTRH